jgi:hypothetical protein
MPLGSLRALKVPRVRIGDPSRVNPKYRISNPIYGLVDQSVNADTTLETLDNVLLYTGIRPYPIIKSEAHMEQIYSSEDGAVARLLIVDTAFVVIGVAITAALVYIMTQDDATLEFLGDPRRAHECMHISTSGYSVIRNVDYAVFLSIITVTLILVILNIVSTQKVIGARRRAVSTSIQLLVKVSFIGILNRYYFREFASSDFLDGLCSVSTKKSEFDDARVSAFVAMLVVGIIIGTMVATHTYDLMRADGPRIDPTDTTTVGIVHIVFFSLGWVACNALSWILISVYAFDHTADTLHRFNLFSLYATVLFANFYTTEYTNEMTKGGLYSNMLFLWPTFAILLSSQLNQDSALVSVMGRFTAMIGLAAILLSEDKKFVNE